MVSSDGAAKERFVVLDGMRGVAALAVIIDHVASPLMQTLIPGRYLAVDFFFVLSGFVLAHVYLTRLAEGRMSPGAFLRVRAIRFAPLYLAAFALGAALALLYALRGWHEHTLPHVATSALFGVFMLPTPPPLSIWPDAPFPLNGPTWSLFFELAVNAVFALVALRWLTPPKPSAPLPELVVNPERPGRVEPRCLKRRKKQFSYMTRPRKELRKLLKTRRDAA